MRILYIAPLGTLEWRARHGDSGELALGGLRKASMTVAALCKAGHEVVVLSSAITESQSRRWRPEERERLAVDGHVSVEIIYPATLPVRPVGGLLNALRAPALARRMQRAFEPDAVIAYNSYLFEGLSALTLKRRSALPFILQMEDLPFARQRELANIKPRLDQRIFGRLKTEASGFTAVNQHILDLLPAHRPRVLLPGIVDGRLLELAAARAEPFTSERHTLGYFGGLSEDKGVGVLLDALPHLPDSWRMVIAGSGPLNGRLARAAVDHPERLDFRGSLAGDELFEALCACDATVVPPERITSGGLAVFPFKCLEYLLAGTHIISTRLPAIGDIDLAYAQRWDGDAPSLKTHLGEAPERYAQEAPARLSATNVARARYSTEGVARLLDSLLNSAVV